MEIGGVVLAILYLTQDEWERIQQVVDLRYAYAQAGRYYVLHVSREDRRIIEGIAYVLLYKYEIEELTHQLMEQYYFTNEAEIGAIVKYAQFLLSQGDIYEEIELQEIMQKRKQELCSLIEAYIGDLEPSDSFHIEGFFRFRLQPLWRSYTKVLEIAIDEYMMEKEYRAYISYLRNVVQERPRQLPLLHVIYKGENDYRLLDDRGNEVDIVLLSQNQRDERIIYDDPIIVDVMMINPEVAVLHYIEEDHHIATSLHNIFEDRYVYCRGCNLCQEGLESRV